jgi:hypothetical protein
VLHMFEFIWIWNLIWIWNWKPYRKEIEKELENPEKKRKRKQPKLAQLGHALARLRRLTGGPRLSAAALSPARSLSCSLPSGADLSALVSSPARSPSLCPAGPVRQLLSRCPERPSPLSLCAVDPPYQIRPPRACRGPTSAHTRTSPDFSVMTPAHAPSFLLRAPPVPRTCPPPPPHFAQLCPLSRSALATRRRRRPAPAPRPSSSPKNAPSLPKLRPEVRHLCPCSISLVSLCAWPILASPVLGRGTPPCSRGGRLI